MPMHPRITGFIAFAGRIRDIRILKILALASLPFFAAFCFFVMEYMNFSGSPKRTFHFFERNPMSALFGLLVVLVIFTILLLICRKAVIAGGIFGLFSIASAYTNYMKAWLNGDNFFPMDIIAVSGIGDLSVFMSGELPLYYWFGVFVIILWIFAFWFFRTDIPLKWMIRLPAALLIIAAVVYMFFTPQRTETILNKFRMNIFDAALQSSNYYANGFVSAFTINVLSMNIDRPADYSRETVLSLLDGYTAVPSAGEDFDIIIVLNESFFDVRLLDVEFSEDPLTNFDRVMQRPDVYSGMIYTTALYGGTIRPEFDMLTGLTTDNLPGGSIPYGLITHDMPSFVSNYRDAGYQTIALHPYTEKFYSRNTAYPFLGFDEFLGENALSEMFDLDYKRGYVTDMSLMEPIAYYLDRTDSPKFLFIITMQNHQPFNPMNEEDIVVQVTSGTLAPGALDSVTTFTQGIYDADRMLGALVDFVEEREKPTLLLFFGDHLPNLGHNLAAYDQSGFLNYDDRHLTEQRLRQYSTPFILFSNRELVPGVMHRDTDNHISSYYMLAAIAQMTEFRRTPYMNLLLDFYTRVPFYNSRLNQIKTADNTELARIMALITYDRLIGGKYSS